MKFIFSVAISLIILFKINTFFFDTEKDYGSFDKKNTKIRNDELNTKKVGYVKRYTKTTAIVGGHGFLIETSMGQVGVIAAHLFTSKFFNFFDPIKRVESLDFILNEKPILENLKPLTGPSYKVCNMIDARNDVGFFKTDSNNKANAFLLSSTAAKAGQHVWLYCSTNFDERLRLIKATVTKSTSFGLFYKFDSSIERRGTSGCPVLNSSLEVVGVNVCLSSSNGVAVPLSSIKKSLSEI